MSLELVMCKINIREGLLMIICRYHTQSSVQQSLNWRLNGFWCWEAIRESHYSVVLPGHHNTELQGANGILHGKSFAAEALSVGRSCELMKPSEQNCTSDILPMVQHQPHLWGRWLIGNCCLGAVTVLQNTFALTRSYRGSRMGPGPLFENPRQKPQAGSASCSLVQPTSLQAKRSTLWWNDGVHMTHVKYLQGGPGSQSPVTTFRPN